MSRIFSDMRSSSMKPNHFSSHMSIVSSLHSKMCWYFPSYFISFLIFFSQPPKWLKICKRVVTPRFLNCPIQFAWPLDNSLSKQEEARVDTCRYPALLGRGCSTGIQTLALVCRLFCLLRLAFFFTFYVALYHGLLLLIAQYLKWRDLSLIRNVQSIQLKLVSILRDFSQLPRFFFLLFLLLFYLDDQQPSGDIQFNIYHRNVRREKNLKNKGGCTRRRENKRNTAWDERFIIKLVFRFYFIYLLLLWDFRDTQPPPPQKSEVASWSFVWCMLMNLPSEKYRKLKEYATVLLHVK